MTGRGGGWLLLVGMTLLGPGAEATPAWSFSSAAAQELELPPAIARQPVLLELEYPAGTARHFGIRRDLDGDGTADYLVRADPALCGNGGCPYAIFDGESSSFLGQVFGSLVRLGPMAIQGWPVFECFSPLGAHETAYSVFVFDGFRFVRVASLVLGRSTWERILEEQAPSERTSQEPSDPWERIGIVSTRNGKLFLSTSAPGVASGASVRLLGSAPGALLVVGRPISDPGEGADLPVVRIGDQAPSTYVLVPRGELPTDRLPSLAVVAPRATGVGFEEQASPDLDGDGVAEYGSACTSNEGIHFSLWSGAGADRVRRWSAYYYLGYDTEPTCSEKEWADPGDSPRSGPERP